MKDTAKNLAIPFILAFILMFRVYVGTDLRANGVMYFMYGTIIAYCLLLMSKNLWVGLFVLLSVFMAHYPRATANSQETLTLVLIGSMLYLTCVHFMNNERALNWSINVICAFALANIVFLILQYFNIDPLHHAKKGYGAKAQLIGLMSYPHGCSAILAMCIAAFRGWWMVFIPFILLGLVMTHTFTGPMAVGFAIMVVGSVYLTKKQFAYLVVSVVSILCIYVFFVDTPDIPWRLRAWKLVLFSYIPQKWVFGYGLGQWQVEAASPAITEFIIQSKQKQIFGSWMNYLHCDPLQMWLELGNLFPIILIGYFVDIARRFNLNAARPVFALCTVFACSMVAFPFHIGYSATVCIFIMAWVEVSLCSRRRPISSFLCPWRWFWSSGLFRQRI